MLKPRIVKKGGSNKGNRKNGKGADVAEGGMKPGPRVLVERRELLEAKKKKRHIGKGPFPP